MPDVWEAWLRQVERVGFASRYQKALDERFDSVEELGARYVRSGTATGGKAVDPKFFEDIGVAHADHRRRFTEFLVGGGTRKVSRAAGRAAATPAADTFLGESCSVWLQRIGVDSQGPCAEALEANFDAVGQILEAYVSEGHADVAAFCADMGVEDGPDRQKFEAWFRTLAACGGASPPSQPPTPKAVSSTAPAPRASTPTAVPAKATPPAASKPKTASRRAMEEWLRRVDPSGSLHGYAEDLDENYDGVDQIEELYITTSGKGGSRRVLSDQFFEDLGVEDANHRALFSEHFASPGDTSAHAAHAPAAPAAPATPAAPAAKAAEPNAMALWLRRLDASGGLDQYLSDLEENYDSIDQIEELYVTLSGGKKVLDAQLFADLGIDLAAHRKIFTSHFEGGSAVMAAVAGGGSAAAPSAAPASTPSLAVWLVQVDPSGGLSCYLKDIEDNYDDVDQILDLYLQDAPSGGGKVLDGQLFDDLGVSSATHIGLFRAWFEKAHGPPAPALAAPAAGSTVATEGPVTIAQWLQEVDPGGAAEAFLAEFNDNYDDVDQIRDLYHVEKNGKKALDEQLFEDMGIKDSALKARFRSWFSANADG